MTDLLICKKCDKVLRNEFFLVTDITDTKGLICKKCFLIEKGKKENEIVK